VIAVESESLSVEVTSLLAFVAASARGEFVLLVL